MAKTENSAESHQNAVSAIDEFKNNLGPFIVAVETTRLAMIFTDAKTHGNLIAFANDSFLELTGYPRDEVIARSISHVLAHVTRAEAIAKLETALNDGFDGTLEMNCERRDGSQFLAAVYMSPVRNNKGELEQNFVSFVEISGIVDSLVHQRNGLYAVYQNAPGFIAGTIGPDHRFTFANKSYHSFVGRRLLEGRTVAEVLPGSIEQGFIGLLDQVYNTGIPFTGVSMPFRLQRMDGFNSEIRYADFVLQPVRDARGVITGLFSEGHDVTEHRLALDKIAALQNEVIHLSRVSAMETMASTLAHELNQPLAAIISYTAGCGRLIAQGPENLDELANGLAAISECSKRAGDIIRTSER
jgi:two-component system sensor kinase FixL